MLVIIYVLIVYFCCMKKILYFFISVFLLFSCEKRIDNSLKEDDNYYVRYETALDSEYIIKSAQATMSTDKGDRTLIIKPKYFCETFGPVSYGFKAKFSSTLNVSTTLKYGTYGVKIYVSKNNEPFVLKEIKSTSSTNLNANYTIDF